MRTAIIVGFLLVCVVGLWGALQRSSADAAIVEARAAVALADSISTELATARESMDRVREVVRVQQEAFTADTARLRSQMRGARARARDASRQVQALGDSLRVHVAPGAREEVEALLAQVDELVAAKDSEISALKVENRRLLSLTTTLNAALGAGDSVLAGVEAENEALRVAVAGYERGQSVGFFGDLLGIARVAVPTGLLVAGALAIF